MTKMRQALAAVGAIGSLLGCQPAGHWPVPVGQAAITVSVMPATAFTTSAAPKLVADVAKVRLRLYQTPANTVSATQTITWAATGTGTGTFTNVADGCYRVGADAFDSSDTSISVGGEQISAGTVTVSGGQVTYPGGSDRIAVSMRLNNGTGQRVVMEAGIAGYAGNTVTPSQYRYGLVRTSDNQTVATYTSTQTLTHFTQVPDGTYRMTAEALDASNRSITVGGATASTNTVTVQAPNVTYSNANGTKLLASLPLFYDRWFSKASFPLSTEALGAAAVNGKIYVTGGWNGTGANLMAFYAYDVATDTWSPRNLQVNGRRDQAVVAANGLVYTVGGGGPDPKMVEAYDPATDTWQTVASMATGRTGAAACAEGGKIYVTGGSDLNSLEIYDTATNTWSAGAPMQTARTRHASAAVNGIVYVAGGYAIGGVATTSVEAYDPATNTWTPCAALPAAAFHLSAASVGHALYVMGGYDTVSQSSVYAYSPATNGWSSRTNMPTPRKGHATAVVNNRIYLFAGTNYSPAFSFVNATEMYEP